MTMPRITIVTPNLNQGGYLEAAIDSVLSQNYPHLKYVVVDGASTDGSAEIIRKYQHHLHGWICERDNGQADAINKGFLQAGADADILAYLNSDDLYCPGALRRVAEAWQSATPRTFWIAGDVVNFSAREPDYLVSYPEEHGPGDRWAWFRFNPVHQPGSFWSAALHRRFGPFDEQYRYVFDYALFLRFRFIGKVRPTRVPETLARFRVHPLSKTGAEFARFEPEFQKARQAIIGKLSYDELRELEVSLRHDRADRLQLSALQAIREGRRAQALAHIVNSLMEQPSLLWQRRTAGCVKRLIL